MTYISCPVEGSSSSAQKNVIDVTVELSSWRPRSSIANFSALLKKLLWVEHPTLQIAYLNRQNVLNLEHLLFGFSHFPTAPDRSALTIHQGLPMSISLRYSLAWIWELDTF